MNWTSVRITIQMIILVTLGIWAMNCEITCCQKDPPAPAGDTPSGDDGGFVGGGGTGGTTTSNNLVDWTSPVHGDIMRPPLTYLFIHFLTEENDNPNDDIDRASFTPSDDVVISVSSGSVDITIQPEVYWGWGGVMMLIDGGGRVDTTYTFRIKKNGTTPIRTVSGTTMNQDVYVSVTLKNGDGVPPTITSSTFDTLNLNMVPPHQPIEFFFSENMSDGRIPWLATKQGGQSVVSAPTNPFGQVIGNYDHLGGYRFLIYNLGAGLDIDTEYEYTILGADMDPALNLFLTPTMDPTGEKMRNTYTKRFRTSKVKITDPKSSNVRVIMGGQEVDVIGRITNLPVQLGIQTGQNPRKVTIRIPSATPNWQDYFNLSCSYTREDFIDQGAEWLWDNFVYPNCNEITINNPVDYFEHKIYFKKPGVNKIMTHFWGQIPQGSQCSTEEECNKITYGGHDYILVNVQPPERQVVANVGILNAFAQQAYLNCQSCIYKKRGQSIPEGYPDCSDEWVNTIQIHPDFASDSPADLCRTIWMDKYYTENGKEVPPALLTTICLAVKTFCTRSESECQEEFDRCNKFEHIDNCKVDRCSLPAGAVVDPNDPQWSEHFVDMCNNYGGILETDRTERCERDAGGNFKIVYYNPTNNIIYHHKRLDWNINKGFLEINPDFLRFNKYQNSDKDETSIIMKDSLNNALVVFLQLDQVEIQNGMAYLETATICTGEDNVASVEGYIDFVSAYFYITPSITIESDGVQRLKFDIDRSGGAISGVELKDHNEFCDGLARDYIENYLWSNSFRSTMKRTFLEGDRPLLQSGILGLFALTGADLGINPDNSQENAGLFQQVGYRSLDDMYINSIQLDQGSDSFLGDPYTKVNLRVNYLWGLRPNY